MSRVQLKLLIAGFVLIGAVGYLCYAGINAGRTYYLSVDSFLSSPEHHDRDVRLHGVVGRDQLDIDLGNPTTGFLLLGDNREPERLSRVPRSDPPAVRPDGARQGTANNAELSKSKNAIRVRYHGAIPDMFTAGVEVVVLGRMGPDGVFNASEILTRCAGKYDMKKTGSGSPS